MKIGDKLIIGSYKRFDIKTDKIGIIVNITKENDKNLYHVEWKNHNGEKLLLGYFKYQIKSWIRNARKCKELKTIKFNEDMASLLGESK